MIPPVKRKGPVNFTWLHRLLLCLLIAGSQYKFIYADQFDHRKFVEKVTHSSAAQYQKIIRIYDDNLKKKSSPGIYIEKCKFIENVFYDSIEGSNPKYAEFNACLAGLIKEYPDDKKVLIYKFQNTWGDSAKALGKALISRNKNENHPLLGELYTDISLTNKEKALIFEKLSYVYGYEDSYQESLEYAQMAMASDDSLNLTGHLARQHINLGQKNLAVKLINKNINIFSKPGDINEAADLLVELGKYKAAIKLYQQIIKDTSLYLDNEKIAQAFSETGQMDSARAYFIKDFDDSYNKQFSLFNLLQFDIRQSSAQTAWDTFTRYRDQGLSSDPLGYLRIRLVFKNPFLPVRFKDFLPLFFAVLIIICCVFIPYIWILPLYFYREYFKKSISHIQSRFGLKHFWIVSAGYLSASFLAYSIFDYQDFINGFSDNIPATEFDSLSTARMSVLFTLLLGVFTFLMLRKNDFTNLITSFKPKNMVWGYIILCVLMILIAGKINHLAFPEWNQQTQNDLLSQSIIQEIKALYMQYGFFCHHFFSSHSGPCL